MIISMGIASLSRGDGKTSIVKAMVDDHVVTMDDLAVVLDRVVTLFGLDYMRIYRACWCTARSGILMFGFF